MNLQKSILKHLHLPAVLGTVSNYSQTWVQIYVASSIGAFFNLAVRGRTSDILHGISRFTICYLLIVMGRELFNYGLGLLSEKAKIDLRSEIYRAFLDNPLSYVENLTTGEILNRLDGDLNKVVSSLCSNSSAVAAGTAALLTYAFVLGGISPYVLICVAALAFLPVLPPLLIADRFAQNYDAANAVEDEIASFQKQCVEGIETVKLLNLYRYLAARYSNLMHKNIALSAKSEKLYQIQSGIEDGIAKISEIGTFAWLGYLIYIHKIPIGDLVQVVMLAGQIRARFQDIAAQIRNLRESRVAKRRVSELLTETPVTVAGVPIASIERLEAQKLAFGYSHGQRVLSELDFALSQGEKIAILGPNGSGKSTLVRLVLGLYESGEGVLSINGRDIKYIDKASYRRNISWVPQESFLLPGTVKDNLTVFCGSDSPELEGLLKLFSITREMLDKRCEELSGGEQRKVVLVRGLLKPHSLLILDEPTNHLDTDSIDALKKLITESQETAIIVTHDAAMASSVSRQVILDAVG